MGFRMRLTQAITLMNVKRLPNELERLNFYSHLSEETIQIIKDYRWFNKRIKSNALKNSRSLSMSFQWK